MTIAVALGAAAASAPAGTRPGTANCSRTSVGLTALPDLGPGRYLGFEGGLYPGGRNSPPARYRKRALAAAAAIRPRAADGRPAKDGRVVLLSIGMSNTTQEFSVFRELAARDALRSRRVVLVDGAQGGQDAVRASDAAGRYWRVVDERLSAMGVTQRQVQALWLKQAIARPTEPFPSDAERLRAALGRIVTIARRRFPNLRLVYLSSRTYAGYAVTPLNPEPFAYQSGFAVKWTIGDRIRGRLRGPALLWGPYLWTDGLRGRRDGFAWSCDDVAADGTHPSSSGRRKVAEQLLRFFHLDVTARRWYLR